MLLQLWLWTFESSPPHLDHHQQPTCTRISSSSATLLSYILLPLVKGSPLTGITSLMAMGRPEKQSVFMQERVKQNAIAKG